VKDHSFGVMRFMSRSMLRHTAEPIDEKGFSILWCTGGRVRSLKLGGRASMVLMILAGVALLWYLFATLFLVLRDDIVVALISSQHRQYYAYEDRIVDLRNRIDKMTTRQLVNQETIEDRVAGLIARQAELEARHIMVADIGTRAAEMGVSTPPQQNMGINPAFSAQAPLGFAPVTMGGPLGAKPRPMPLDAAAPDPLRAPDNKGFEPIKMRGSVQAMVKTLEERSAAMDDAQISTLRAISEKAQGTVSLGQQALAVTGLNGTRFGKLTLPSTDAKPAKMVAPVETFSLRNVETPLAPGGMGGPLLPVLPNALAERFEANLGLAENALRDAQNAKSILRAIPLYRPLPASYETTSTFGTRYDPFTRAPAMHSGIDFRAATGTPVRAAAGGKVITAEPTGGYGKLVEIDHGFGISTRYGHLSAILVREGDIIPKGTIIGQVGSTGRSTGPHLHYEVRLDDDATDPQRFLRAANMLGTN